MKYSNTAITQLTRLYKSILVKCAIFNAAILMSSAFVATPAMADHTVITDNASLSGTYQGSTANDDGGVFFVDAEGKTVEIKSSKFTGNSVTGNNATGGAISLKSGTLNIDDTVFTSNTAPYSGAIFTYSGGNKLKITNSQFNSNEALGAGALQAMFETEIKDTSFTGNKATGDSSGAGALFVGAVGKTKLDNVTFANNTSATRGGAISTRAADLADNSEAKIDILGSTFTGNTAGTTGGAIDNYMYSSVKDATAVYIDDTTFTNNTANKGGAIYNHGQTDKAGKTSSLKIVNSTFTGNGVDATSGDVVAQYGGAIYNEAHASMSIEGTFTGNKAVRGGAIYTKGKITVEDSTFDSNSAVIGSGAIHQKYSDLIVKKSQFKNNNAGYFGAIWSEADADSLTITDSSFEKNTANEVGAVGAFKETTIKNTTFTGNKATSTASDSDGAGALFLGAVSKTEMTNVTFDSNESATRGGAISTRSADLANNSAAKVDIISSTFTGNKAGTTGGAIDNYLYSSKADAVAVYVNNSIFDENEAAQGGAVYNHGEADKAGNIASMKIVDSDFTNNTATTAGGAVYNMKNAGLTIAAVEKDVTFSGNKANNADNDIYNAGNLALNAASEKTISLAGGIDGDSENKGTLNITGAGLVDMQGKLTNQTVNVSAGELALSNGAADGSNLSGSTVNVESGATMNTIDNVINDYSSVVTLANGAKVKADADLSNTGSIDTYKLGTAGGTITLADLRVLKDSAAGASTVLTIAEGANVTVADAVKAYTTSAKYTATGSTDTSGRVTIRNAGSGTGGLNAVVDETQTATVDVVTYALTGNDDFSSADNTIENADVEIVGNGTGDGDYKVVLNNDLVIDGRSTVSIETAKFEQGTSGTKEIQNQEGGVLKITDSKMNVDIYNAGTLISDPTYYGAKVVNEGTASFDGDIFETTASLENNATVNLSGGTEFKSGAFISGSGVLNLVSDTTVFNNTASSNTVNLASGADWTGALASTNVVNTQNANIDTVTGSVTGGDLYIDANVAGGTIDTFGSASGATVKGINITSSAYGTQDKVTLALNGASLDSNVEITGGTNYYTSITQNGDNVVFSDKLINESGLYNKVGSWADGEYVKQSSDIDHAADGTTYMNVGQAITALDTAVANLDTGLHDVATIVGPAQTTAATTGQFVGRKIGADINLVNAVDELGRNMVSLGAENVFTRLNTFKNDGGIALQDSAGGNSTRLKATTDGLSVDRNVEATGFKIAGQAPVVTSIDTDGTTVTSAATAANVMATSATVYNGAEKGQYTGAKVNGDTATTHTINSALAKTNTTLNGILTTAGTEVDSTKVDVQWNSTDSTLATVLGNGVYSSTNNVAAGDSVTTAIGKLDSALKTTNDTIGARAIEAGTAGTLTGKTIGTAAGNISVVDALETLNATNVSQNGSMNTLAGLINGGSVDASTGAYTAGSATLNTGSGVGQFAATNLTAAANELMSDITVAAGTYNYISQGSNVGSNLIALDTQVKNVKDKVAVVGTPEAAAVTDGGILDGKAITGDSSVSGHMTLVEAVRYMSEKAAGLDLNNTFTGNNTFNGTVKIGSANAISSTTDGELNMGNNELTNVAGLTLVNGSADVALNADASGNLVVDSGVIANSLGIGTAGTEFTVDTSGNTKTGTLQIGAANAITGTASSLNMGANDLTNIKNLTTTGNATVGGGLGVTGTSNLHDTNVEGNLTIVDTADPTKKVTMDVRDITADSAPVSVLQTNGNSLTTGTLATSDRLKVVHKTAADTYTTVFDVKASDGSMTSDMLSTNNTGNTVTIGKNATSATTVNGIMEVTGATQLDSTLTADGESKFGKDTSGVYSLDVTDSAVTANKVVEAKAGVKFGTDTTAMTDVSRANISSVVDHTANDSVIASVSAVQETRKDIEDKAHSVLGDVYKIDATTRAVSYDNTAIAGTNGFESGATNLTDALTKYADNVQAAMGTTYATNGTFTNNFAKPAAVDYDGLATDQTLVAAISQLDKNIGTAITGTDRSGTAFDTSATNTVNENIAALDAAIGADVTKEYNGVVKTNSINQNIDAISTTLGRMDNLSTAARTAGNAVVVRGNLTNANNTPLTTDLTVADALSNIDQTLGRIHGLYDGTKVNVTDASYPSVTGANSNLAKGTTVENHLVSLDNAIGSRNIASLNADINKAVNGDATATAGTEARNGSLALGLQSVGDQMGDMNFTSTHYVAAGDNLSGAVRTLDSNLYRVEEDLRDLRRDFNNGMASMSAMSALVPNPRAAGNTSLSVGTGAYNGRTAVAVGGFHHINDNIMLNAGAAWGNASDVAYRLGITWSW